MVHCMQSPYKSIKSVQLNQHGGYFLVWKHDKIYKKVDKLKASFKRKHFCCKYKKLEFQNIFKFHYDFIFCIEYNIHWLQNLKNFWIKKVKNKYFLNWLVKMVFKNTSSSKKPNEINIY
jgi:hypothetical protein